MAQSNRMVVHPNYNQVSPMWGTAGMMGMPGMVPGMPGVPQVQLMSRPAPMRGVPPGLEYLAQIDQLLVHQTIEFAEMITNWETENKYQIKNSVGQQVYFATEESGGCTRQCCGNKRGFTMHIADNMGAEIIQVKRPFKCCHMQWCACLGCCSDDVTIEAPVGDVIGTVKQVCSFCAPSYAACDATGNKVFDIVGPVCFCQDVCCTSDIEFRILAGNGEEVGKISKQWGGIIREAYTKADNFSVTFPVDLDVRIKATLLGAVLLIDFMHFEKGKR